MQLGTLSGNIAKNKKVKMDKINAPTTCTCSARLARANEGSPMFTNLRIETPEIKAYHPLSIITRTVKMDKNDIIFLNTRVAYDEILLVVIVWKEIGYCFSDVCSGHRSQTVGTPDDGRRTSRTVGTSDVGRRTSGTSGTRDSITPVPFLRIPTGRFGDARERQ